MARLTLRLEDQVLKEYVVVRMATIGRLSDNTVMIDDPAVSSHHACLFREGDQFVVEDLQSTNGTLVNGTRVSRHAVQYGDEVVVGKHRLMLDQPVVGESTVADGAEGSVSNHGETVFLDSRSLMNKLLIDSEVHRKHEASLARLRDVESDGHAASSATAESIPEMDKVGVLRVLDGRADQSEYTLERHTSLIGKGKASLVRLRGWFKPYVAVAITRNRLGYVPTVLGGKMLINNKPVSGRYELKDGDVLWVSGLLLEFRLKG